MKFVDELLSYLRDRIVEVGVRSAEFPLLSDFFESVSAAYPRARLSPDPMFVIETTIAKVAFGPVARVAYDDAEVPVSKTKVPEISREEAEAPKEATAESNEAAVSALESPRVSEPPSVSVAELVAKLKGIPKSAALVQAVKNAPKSAFSDASTFLISAKNSIDSTVLSKSESRAAIAECLQSLCGYPISVRIETVH
jgi:hypothetical protein